MKNGAGNGEATDNSALGVLGEELVGQSEGSLVNAAGKEATELVEQPLEDLVMDEVEVREVVGEELFELGAHAFVDDEVGVMAPGAE